MSWPEVHAEAVKFLPMLNEERWRDYVEEMGGVAEGAGVEFVSVLALNVRTEIAYGMFNDACTALSWREHDGPLSFLAQNWDVCRLNVVKRFRGILENPSCPTPYHLPIFFPCLG